MAGVLIGSSWVLGRTAARVWAARMAVAQEAGGQTDWWRRQRIVVPLGQLAADAHVRGAEREHAGISGPVPQPSVRVVTPTLPAVLDMLNLPDGRAGVDWRVRSPKQPLRGTSWLLKPDDEEPMASPPATAAPPAAGSPAHPQPTVETPDGDDKDLEDELPGTGGGTSVAVDPFFASELDLTHHRSNEECWNHFDFGMLSHWDAQARLFCSPRAFNDGSMAPLAADVKSSLDSDAPMSGAALMKVMAPYAAHESWLVCRVQSDAHLPPATAPHTICDGANIVLDTTRMTPSSCLQFRPGYKCDGPPVFWSYTAGALQASCSRRPSFGLHSFPADHLKDLFSAFDSDAAQRDVTSAPPTAGEITLVVTRERGEHANTFHSTTDLMNAFFM